MKRQLEKSQKNSTKAVLPHRHKKVLLVGQSATMHAIGEKFKESGAELYVYGKIKNIGLAPIAEDYATGSLTDLNAVEAFAKRVKPDFAFVNNPPPLEAGMVNRLASLGIPSVGPFQKVAELESSKAFGRKLMEKYHIPGKYGYKIFTKMEGVKEFLESLKGNYVMKADGIVSWGEGVRVSGQHLPDLKSAVKYAKQCLDECGKLIIEEKLVGQEFSFMNFVDGIDVVPMPVVQDHKRAFNNDKGPNTGGMGSMSDANHLLPFIKRHDLHQAHDISRRIVHAVYHETGLFFKGILYIGFMLTKDGLRVLEFNVRSGDPEGMNTFSLLKTNLLDISEAIMNQDLANLKIEFEHKAVVTKYMAPKGYPEQPKEGSKFYKKAPHGKAKIFYGYVEATPKGFKTGVERAIASVGIADTLMEAEKISEQGCKAFTGSIFHRSDIANPKAIQKKIAMMESLRAQGAKHPFLSFGRASVLSGRM